MKKFEKTVAQNCIVYGIARSLPFAKVKTASFIIQANDQFRNRKTEGGDNFRVVLMQRDICLLEMPVQDNKDGSNTVSYSAQHPGEYNIDVVLVHPDGRRSKINEVSYPVIILPDIKNFMDKREWFKNYITKSNITINEELKLSRDTIYMNSFNYLKKLSANQLREEWATILAFQMFSKSYGLWTHPEGSTEIQINPQSYIMNNHLEHYNFAGRFIGKIMYDNFLSEKQVYLPIPFTKLHYSLMLGEKDLFLDDLKNFDTQLYTNYSWFLENDVSEVDQNFVLSIVVWGQHKEIELKPNGAKILVTNQNKKEFVQLACQTLLYANIEKQMESFLSGFRELIPHLQLPIYSEEELEMLICGKPDINISDLKAHTKYGPNTGESSKEVIWFWELAEKEFTAENKRDLLKFSMGFEKAPLDGFGSLNPPFTLQIKDEKDIVPSASTCFSIFKLARYSSYQLLKEKVLKAISEGNEGFDLS